MTICKRVNTDTCTWETSGTCCQHSMGREGHTLKMSRLKETYVNKNMEAAIAGHLLKKPVSIFNTKPLSWNAHGISEVTTFLLFCWFQMNRPNFNTCILLSFTYQTKTLPIVHLTEQGATVAK